MFCGIWPLRECYLSLYFLSSHNLILLYNQLQMPVKSLTVSACDLSLFVIQNFIAILFLVFTSSLSSSVSSANFFTFIHISCPRSVIYKMNKNGPNTDSYGIPLISLSQTALSHKQLLSVTFKLVPYTHMWLTPIPYLMTLDQMLFSVVWCRGKWKTERRAEREWRRKKRLSDLSKIHAT